MYFHMFFLPWVFLSISVNFSSSSQYFSVSMMFVDTCLDRAEPLLSVEGVHMLVKLSPPTDQRQSGHYLCVGER